MEMLVLLFLIAYANGDDDFKLKLRSALDFYRENREIIQMFMKNGAPASATSSSECDRANVQECASEVPHDPSKAEESRPLEGVGDVDVLIKYLGGLH